MHHAAAKPRLECAVNSRQPGCFSVNMQTVLSLSFCKPVAIADPPDRPFVIAVGLLKLSLAHEITRLAPRSGSPLRAQACDERVLTRRIALSPAPGTFLTISSAFSRKLTTDTGSIRVPDGP
jgi:hypothetical protein